MAAVVVGLVGATGSGKTTLARQLVARHNFINLHMGRPLKDMLVALGLKEEDVAGTPAQRLRPQPLLGGKSARDALSTLGTDWGRNMVTPDLWANALKLRIDQAIRHSPDVRLVIDDLRFPNDWAAVQQVGGVILTVRRPTVEQPRTVFDTIYHRFGFNRSWLGRSVFGRKAIHESEFHWRDAPTGAEVWNTGTVDELLLAAVSALRAAWAPRAFLNF